MAYLNKIKDGNKIIVNKCNELIRKRELINTACEFAYMTHTTMLKHINYDDEEQVLNVVCMGIELAKQFDVDYNSLNDTLQLLESAIEESNIIINEYASMGLDDMVESFNTVKEVHAKYMELVKNTIKLYENKYLKDINFEAVGGIK